MVQLLSILNKKTPFRFAQGTGETLMDIELVENIKHNYVTTISKSKGALSTTADNLKNENITINMICRISNNPVSLASNLQGVVSSVLPSNPLAQQLAGQYIVKLSNTLLKNSQNRRQDFFDKLVEMRENKVPFDVITGLKAYQNMIFAVLTMEENRSAENCLIFSCTLEQVNLKSKTETGKTKLSGLQKLKEIRDQGSILFNLAIKFGN